MKLSKHAIGRFQERVRPALTLDQAAKELHRLIPFARRLDTLDWHRSVYEHESPPDYYVELSDGIALAIKNGCAITCLIRDGHSEGSRAHRNRLRKTRKARSQRRRKTQQFDQKHATYRRDRKWAA